VFDTATAKAAAGSAAQSGGGLREGSIRSALAEWCGSAHAADTLFNRQPGGAPLGSPHGGSSSSALA